MKWEDVIDGVNPKEQGTTEAKVNLIDTSDTSKVVTLYVRLRKTKRVKDNGLIHIYESQISKTIHSNDKHINETDKGIWGKYKFTIGIGDFTECHSMPGPNGDNELKFVFKRTSDQDALEIKGGVHDTTDPKTYNNNSVHTELTKTISSIKLESNKFTFKSDGTRSDGFEYVTVLWRGTDSYKDLPTLAKFKQQDIEDVYGSDNYEIPKAMLKQEDRKSLKKRASAEIELPLTFSFGLDEEGSDIDATSSCAKHKKGECIPTLTLSAKAIEETQFIYDFNAKVQIDFYAGEEKQVASEEPTKNAVRSNSTGFTTKGEKEIKFFPYIKMTFMDNTLDHAKKEEQNTKHTGYKQDVRKDTYVLSEHESSILPYDAVELYWYHPNGNDDTIKLTSQQWSTHKKATSGSDGWQGPNQVLPGGAIYQLSTDQNNPAKVVFTTYNTIVDEKAKKEYLTSDTTLGSNDYTTDGIAEDILDFINQAKSSLDNLKIVQWVNKDFSAVTAWPSDFSEGSGAVSLRGKGEDLSSLRSGTKTTANTEDKYYMRQQPNDALASYDGRTKLSDITANLIKDNVIDSKKEIVTQGDLDVTKCISEATILKLFTNTEGKVYSAITKVNIKDEEADGIKDTLDKAIEGMKDLNADTMGSASGVTVQEICKKDTSWDAINGILKDGSDEKDIDNHTLFITNIVKSLLRNEGNDPTAKWANGKTDGKWYNEAFDGIYMVRIKTTIDVGLQYPKTRTTALDPALCPPNKGQADLYSTAFSSQFCLDSKSDASIASAKEKGYLGTYKGQDLCLPNIEEMYKSRVFYIPNANVQDLN